MAKRYPNRPGQPRSQACRAKIAQALRGRKHSPERCRKIAVGNRKPKPAVSIALSGKRKTDSHRNNIRLAQLNRLQAIREWDRSYKADEELPFFGIITDNTEEDEYF
jgi:hypothetical protein